MEEEGGGSRRCDTFAIADCLSFPPRPPWRTFFAAVFLAGVRFFFAIVFAGARFAGFFAAAAAFAFAFAAGCFAAAFFSLRAACVVPVWMRSRAVGFLASTSTLQLARRSHTASSCVARGRRESNERRPALS